MSTQQTPQWAVYEVALESAGSPSRSPDAPLAQAIVTAPSGRSVTRDAFWDGGRTWRLRICPDEIGVWSWRIDDLAGQSGSFDCVAATGDNPFARHGALGISADGRSFAHADGTPFFWVGDTCWNGVLRATAEDWEEYLSTRRDQGFSVIQFIATTWRALAQDPAGERPYADDGRLNPAFFQRLDPKVAAINAHGMLAAPILLHDNGAVNPGATLREADAIQLARYLVARWSAYQMAYTLGGDGRYDGERMGRWQRIGRGVFGDQPDRLVTMHPEGGAWFGETMLGEPWLNFLVYQSGHGAGEQDLRWHVQGPPASAWRTGPPRPVLNAEPCYEAHPAWTTGRDWTAGEVRRAIYWSLLLTPTAGVTYGHQWIWPWNTQIAVPEGHEELNYAPVPPWREGIHAPGALSVGVMRKLFATIPWPHLRPAPELVRTQPGDADPARHIVAARTEDGAFVLVYMPVGGPLELNPTGLPHPLAATWFDPRSGTRTEIGIIASHNPTLQPPDEHDWLLILTADQQG